MNLEGKTILVTGSSSGIGRCGEDNRADSGGNSPDKIR
jgi:short-subunit dehydrogenase involved in D-alanine esterification of teichoic acids